MDVSIDTKASSCPKHGDFESKAIRLFGRVMGWSGCPQCLQLCDDTRAAERRAAEKKARQERLESALDRAGIPRRFRAKTFDSFEADTTAKADCLRIAMEFVNDFHVRHSAGETMVFSGRPGTGKSHLAIAICHAIMGAGYTAFYINALDVIGMIRSTWRKDGERTESDVLRELTAVDLLVIDEVGVQYGTDGEKVILFDIINRRYQDQRPMVLLTNQGREGLKTYLGDRAFDRLREAGRWVPFDWESWRGNAA